MSQLIIETLDWAKTQNLLPAIIQDALSAQVLMCGYVSRASLEQTLATQKVTFYSRSQKKLWEKGETSGNCLNVVSMHADCDRDCLLILVNPEGPTCHLGSVSCFGPDATPALSTLAQLITRIDERANTSTESSYTARLLQGDIKRSAQKVAEEGVEVALAAATHDAEEFNNECADLLYHLFVLLKHMDIPLTHICQVLAKRMQT